jgi:hypothetical protein
MIKINDTQKETERKAIKIKTILFGGKILVPWKDSGIHVQVTKCIPTNPIICTKTLFSLSTVLPSQSPT